MEILRLALAILAVVVFAAACSRIFLTLLEASRLPVLVGRLVRRIERCFRARPGR